MKKLFILSIAAIFASAAFGQKIDESQVPDLVTKTFKARFTTAKDVKWEKEDSIYEASFLMDETTTEAEFSDKGTWMNTEWTVPVQYTPQKIKNYLDTACAGYKINELNVMEFPTDGKLYVIEIAKKKVCKKVYFALTGEFKKSEMDVCEKGKKCCKDKKK
jgi:hypothetical protein